MTWQLSTPSSGWVVGLCAMALSVVIAGCGGGGADAPMTDEGVSASNTTHGSPNPSTGIPAFRVGGVLSGLSAGTSIALTNNDSETITLRSNGPFAFKTPVNSGAAYAVAISAQPKEQICAINNATGTVHSSVIAQVRVSCKALPMPTAKLLFKSNFGPGVSIRPPSDFYPNGKGAWQSIVGTDKETGFTWPIKALGAHFSGIQLITIDEVTKHTIDEYITNTIEPVAGPDGTLINQLFQNVKIKGPVGEAGSQAPFILVRPTNIGDVTDLYISYWYKHPADLASKLDPFVSSGNWKVQFEFKTGGYEGGWRGDYRIATNVMKGKDGKLYWMSKGDNVANGPWDRVDYWVVRNTDVPVPVGKWFKFEVFWHRSTGDDGRYWAAVDGKVIVDYIGKNTMGHLGLPINRIMFNNAYSGGHPAVQAHTTGLEIWDGFPCGVGKSCYTPPM